MANRHTHNRWWVGESSESTIIFEDHHDPDEDHYGSKYDTCYGPFRTKAQAHDYVQGNYPGAVAIIKLRAKAVRPLMARSMAP